MFRRIAFVLIASTAVLLLAISGSAPAIAQDATPAFTNFAPTDAAELKPSVAAEVEAPAPTAAAPQAAPAANDNAPDTIVGFGSTIAELVALAVAAIGGLVGWLESWLRSNNKLFLANLLHGTTEEDGILDRAVNFGMQYVNAHAKDLANVDVKNAVIANAILYLQEMATGTLKKFRANNPDAMLKLILPHLPDVPEGSVAVPKIFGERLRTEPQPSEASAAAPAAAPPAWVAELQQNLANLIASALQPKAPAAAAAA